MNRLRIWILLLLIGNYGLRSSREDIEYVKYGPSLHEQEWIQCLKDGKFCTTWDLRKMLPKNLTKELEENNMTIQDTEIKSNPKIYDMRTYRPKKRWSINWVSEVAKKKVCKKVTPSCNISYSGDELPDLDFGGDLEEPLFIKPQNKEERERQKQEKIKKRDMDRKVSLEETRMTFKPFQNHRLHESICQIYTFINNNVLNRAFKPAEEMIFWSEHLGVDTRGMTINMPQIDYVDSILFDSRLSDLNIAYNVLIHELGHARVTLLEDNFIPAHGNVFKKICRQIMKGITQNRNLQPAEMKNLVMDRKCLNAKS